MLLNRLLENALSPMTATLPGMVTLATVQQPIASFLHKSVDRYPSEADSGEEYLAMVFITGYVGKKF